MERGEEVRGELEEERVERTPSWRRCRCSCGRGGDPADPVARADLGRAVAELPVGRAAAAEHQLGDALLPRGAHGIARGQGPAQEYGVIVIADRRLLSARDRETLREILTLAPEVDLDDDAGLERALWELPSLPPGARGCIEGPGPGGARTE